MTHQFTITRSKWIRGADSPSLLLRRDGKQCPSGLTTPQFLTDAYHVNDNSEIPDYARESMRQTRTQIIFASGAGPIPGESSCRARLLLW